MLAAPVLIHRSMTNFSAWVGGNWNRIKSKMAARYREKRTLITTVWDQYLSSATFPTPLIFHYPLPLRMLKYCVGFYIFIGYKTSVRRLCWWYFLFSLKRWPHYHFYVQIPFCKWIKAEKKWCKHISKGFHFNWNPLTEIKAEHSKIGQFYEAWVHRLKDYFTFFNNFVLFI